MKYDFTTVPDRRKQGSEKWDLMYACNKEVREGIVPMSVADMELKNPPEIIEGLKEYLDEVILGYATSYDEFTDAVIDWFDRRHNYKIKEEWIVQSPGSINAFTAGLKAFAKKGEGVIINRPVYYPMGIAIERCGLKEVNVPLINDNGKYSMDMEAMERACKDPNNKIFLFCSPHNPTCRVWSKKDLIRLGQMCVENDVVIISDEVWNDIIMPGHSHTMISSISQEVENITMTCTGPAKTFNIAGMMTSNIIIPNEKMRQKFKWELEKMRSHNINVLGYKACELAYTRCDEWLEEMLELIDTNRKLCKEFFESRGFVISDTEGTYLAWVDFSKLGMNHKELEEFMQKEAQCFTDEGYVFGEEGQMYERFNLALPTASLKKQLENLDQALIGLSKK